MKIEKLKTKRRSASGAWSRLDHKLFRMNLSIYQADLGEPSPDKLKTAVRIGHFRAS